MSRRTVKRGEFEDSSDPVNRFLRRDAPSVAEIERRLAEREVEKLLLHAELYGAKKKRKPKGGTAGRSVLGKALKARQAKMSKVRQAVQAGRVVRRIKIR